MRYKRNLILVYILHQFLPSIHFFVSSSTGSTCSLVRLFSVIFQSVRFSSKALHSDDAQHVDKLFASMNRDLEFGRNSIVTMCVCAGALSTVNFKFLFMRSVNFDAVTTNKRM
uniref:Secreted protein n=1 Tax=Parascaris univalens TaxID=6257 RepID=A0A915BVR3_PARUN